MHAPPIILKRAKTAICRRSGISLYEGTGGGCLALSIDLAIRRRSQPANHIIRLLMKYR